MQIFSSQIEETQSVCIHDILSAEGFAMHYRAISNRGSHFEVFRYERIVYFRVPYNREAAESNMAIQLASLGLFIISIQINHIFHPQVILFSFEVKRLME